MTNRICKTCTNLYFQSSSLAGDKEKFCSMACQLGTSGDKVTKSKYKAQKCEEDGIKFPSKLERDYYLKLKALQKCGEIAFFLRQVRFDLPGGVKYLADYLIVNTHGSIEFVDCKGMDTPMSTLKMKQVEALYPVKIKIVRKV